MSDIFDHPFFRKALAFASLQHNDHPAPDVLRACLMELVRYVLRDGSRMDFPVPISANSEAVKRLVEAARAALVVMEIYNCDETSGGRELDAALAAFQETKP